MFDSLVDVRFRFRERDIDGCTVNVPDRYGCRESWRETSPTKGIKESRFDVAFVFLLRILLTNAAALNDLTGFEKVGRSC